jgi:hypothetical protein
MQTSFAQVPDMNYAQGGGIQALAGHLQKYGQDGDTVLAHISPQEAKLLEGIGGAGVPNPYTGLPEYGLGKKLKKILRAIAPVLSIASMFIPGIGVLGSSLINAGIGGLTGEKGFDFKRALTSGAMSYGLGSLAQGVMGAGAAGGFGDAAAGLGSAGAAPVSSFGDAAANAATAANAGAGINPMASIGGPLPSGAGFGAPTIGGAAPDLGGLASAAPAAGAAAGAAPGAMSSAITTAPSDFYAASLPTDFSVVGQPTAAPSVGSRLGDFGRGASDLAFGDAASRQQALAAFRSSMPVAPTTALGIGYMGYTGGKALDEQEAAQEEFDAQRQASEAQAARYRALASRSLGYAQGGGITALKAGGPPSGMPRYVDGAGDGMSDSIPAHIDGRQRAALSDGEFVIPADVVSHLGNGSSKAGAKQLYTMMDRVREQRTGRAKQAPQINNRRLMPA